MKRRKNEGEEMKRRKEWREGNKEEEEMKRSKWYEMERRKK